MSATTAAVSRMAATSFGKIPTTRLRRLISLFRRFERIGAPDLTPTPGGHPVDVGLHDHRVERHIDPAAGRRGWKGRSCLDGVWGWPARRHRPWSSTGVNGDRCAPPCAPPLSSSRNEGAAAFIAGRNEERGDEWWSHKPRAPRRVAPSVPGGVGLCSLDSVPPFSRGPSALSLTALPNLLHCLLDLYA